MSLSFWTLKLRKRREILRQNNELQGRILESRHTIRIATRHSPLAMWQAEHVAKLLAELELDTVLVPLASSGDIDMRPIDGTRQVGVFTKRIQQALIDDEADVAVHSLKDLPTEPDPRLIVSAIPNRELVNDSLVSPQEYTIQTLPRGARIGTGSRRRVAQLLHSRPDLNVSSIRGNVQTRLSKIADGEFDAIILAEAGLARLEMSDVRRSVLSLDEMLPAPGQGALAIEIRSDDTATQAASRQIDHLATRLEVTAERTVLANLNGGCLAPIAAHGTIRDSVLNLKVMVLSVDGATRLIESGSVDLPNDLPPAARVGNDASQVDCQPFVESAMELAGQLSERLASQGARELIQSVR